MLANEFKVKTNPYNEDANATFPMIGEI